MLNCATDQCAISILCGKRVALGASALQCCMGGSTFRNQATALPVLVTETNIQSTRARRQPKKLSPQHAPNCLNCVYYCSLHLSLVEHLSALSQTFALRECMLERKEYYRPVLGEEDEYVADKEEAAKMPAQAS